jgi:hypothetical protein
VLRQAGQVPVHILAVQSRTMSSLRILHHDRLRVICTTAPHGHASWPLTARSGCLAGRGRPEAQSVERTVLLPSQTDRWCDGSRKVAPVTHRPC